MDDSDRGLISDGEDSFVPVGDADAEGRMLGEDQADALMKIAVSGRTLDVLVGPAGAGNTTRRV